MIRLRIVTDMVSRNKELKRLLDQMFYGRDAGVCWHGQTWTPQMDIYETPEAVMILAEVPGLRPEDIEVVVDRSHLKISGCRNQPAPSGSLLVHQMEVGYGSFERVFRLPSPVRPEEAQARVENGFLTIVLPKAAPGRSTVVIR